jgi:hypothetical protein
MATARKSTKVETPTTTIRTNPKHKALTDRVMAGGTIGGYSANKSKYKFADETTPDGNYPVVQLKYGKNGVLLVTDSLFTTGETLVFFEQLDTQMGEMICNSSSKLTAIIAVMENGSLSYLLSEIGCYVFDGKTWELSIIETDEPE